MYGTGRYLTLSDTPFGAGQFVGLWATSAVTYGAGDTVTTVAVIWYSAVVETNPVVGAVAAFGGVPGLVLPKLAAFLLCLALSLDAARRADRLGFYAPPATLTVLGAFATIRNVLLLAGRPLPGYWDYWTPRTFSENRSRTFSSFGGICAAQ